MKNPTGKNIEELVFGMFDQMIEGADKYVTKQGSTWLIFTEDKRWVIEFTRDKTLWFNYNIFQSELELIGKDCTEERDLIKRWFESRFLNTPKVEETLDAQRISQISVERAIQEGVKNTLGKNYDPTRGVEDIIQNGVKRTEVDEHKIISDIKDVIQNGVKETTPSGYLGSIEMKGKIVHQIESPKQNNEVEDTIENGVKYTQFGVGLARMAVEEIIQNGVKDTRSYSDRDKKTVVDIIQSGVKETYESKSTKSISLRHAIKNGVKHVEDGDWLDQDERIDDIIENGVKELKELPDKSGELRGYGDWYHRQGNMTKPHTEYVKEVIEDSYNHMGRVEGIIRNTDKDGI